jgi:hypothetical protein
MRYSRRDFLKNLAVLSGTVMLPREFNRLAPSLTAGDLLTPFLTAMQTPFNAPLNEHFERVIDGNPVALLLYDLTADRMVTALLPETLFPVASAFKAPLLMYFLDVIAPEVWNIVPVEYWNAARAEDVPEAAREAWRQHQAILWALHQMIILSDNTTTGVVFSYIAAALGGTAPLVMFNDWARQRVGMSQLSGITAWNVGVDPNMSALDRRLEDRGTTLNGQVVYMDNMMTARDLGLFYVWMLTTMTADQQRVAKSLLSILYNNRGANLERLALENDGIPYSKNGSLETEHGYVVSDAGLIELPQRTYLLVILSLGADAIIPTLYDELNATIQGRYNEIFHNHRVNAVSNEELLALYTAHVQAAYPEHSDLLAGQFRYGFVLPVGVEIFSSPDEQHPLHNPIIKSTRFGIHLLMQGALVRYTVIDEDWVELVPDDHRDNVRVRLGNPLFMRQRDLWPISLGYAEPIPYLVNPTITHSDKYILISLAAHELFLFEGETPVVRIPIVLNAEATPRGSQVITSKWLARSMQPWAPGVPFTAFFGEDGFALHGAPWQRWGITVNQSNITGRTSAGCVNAPNWLVTAGGYQRPADELLFRWIGGIEHPRESVYEYPSQTYPSTRIYSVDYPHNLRNYIRPEVMTQRNLSWDDIIAQMEATPLQAPESFFV